MPSPSRHAFRYEPALCTLPEGATLADWRREGGATGTPATRRGSLAERLRAVRPGARRVSAR